ncbi:uncharacterized protein MELLADRAFT_69104 [Melampsora larici-populina 98AG31]|uniref:Uncharacterized protein n=1 Tax=Melampsora larici-populina (strain 98AG31 / pathotype 3-4-7) TaxID=747676 RepID=F4S9E5_MELLP|nr:uncharacterized protein MELLADRAFT_69104 [Melampsora larici-populina 98AG31]EGF98708.1 hypothetical protein MELLADRAFT_69104 [Melampsora larici-populina 98AG31]
MEYGILEARETRIMAHYRFLSFYLLLILLPSLDSLPLISPLAQPLLKASYKELAEIDHEDPKTPILLESFTNSHAGSQKAHSRNGKSIFQIPKGRFNNFFATQSQSRTLKKKALASWEVCYSISQKIEKSNLPEAEVQELAKAVLSYGPQFILDRHDSQKVTESLISTINLFSRSLQMDFLNPAERIWSFEVLSVLRSRIPKKITFTIPDIWTVDDLGRDRVDFLLFFLQDKDLGKATQEMWSKSPPKLETSEQVIQEAIQRESIVRLINQQIGKSSGDPSTEFKTLYLAFINLKTPIDSTKASTLMRLIESHLEYPKTQQEYQFDEEANTVRMLFHLQEYHYQSYFNFMVLTDTRQDLRRKILQNDISFQLEEKLPQSVIGILKELEITKYLNTHQISKILEIIKQEEMSIAQLGRFFRVINLVVKSNFSIWRVFNHQLDGYSLMIPKLSKMLKSYRSGRMNPEGDAWEILESLIFVKNEDLLAKEFRDNLAKGLVIRGVLSESDTVEQYLPGESKQDMVDRMLYGIFKKRLDTEKYKHRPNTRNILVEYILHLISFKNSDKFLYSSLRSLANLSWLVPQNPALRMLSQEVSVFVERRSWDTNGRMDEFRTALQKLEEAVYMTIYQTETRWNEVLTGQGKERERVTTTG